MVDDFGSGYSSLVTLNMKCFDTLKIDKSLIDDIGDSNGERRLVHTIAPVSYTHLDVYKRQVHDIRYKLEID